MSFIKDRVQLRNPITKNYVLVDTKNAKILEHSPKRFKSVQYIKGKAKEVRA